LGPVTRERTLGRHKPLSIAAQVAGREYWIGESNSVACAGKHNISDVMGAGLWAIDYMLSMAAINVTGINFHHGGYYSNFVQNSSEPAIPIVRALFYGEWFFAQTVRHKSVALANPIINTTNINIIPHSFLDLTDGTLRVAVVHLDMNTTQSATAIINITNFNMKYGMYSDNATVVRFLGPNVLSMYGLSLGGQTFDGTTNGIPIGKRNPEDIKGSKGVYTFTIAPLTAVLLEIPQLGSSSVKFN